ncbi:MAG: PKD domain-containing protein, partial [Thaumarchaeota archaeon]|nr:PKD domain-containing protein [Nitrososphaerota archaeon]
MKQETAGQVTKDTPITITKFSANPSAGPAPLTVAFHAEAQGGLQPYSQWTFDFGDTVVDVPNGFGQSSVDMQYT